MSLRSRYIPGPALLILLAAAGCQEPVTYASPVLAVRGAQAVLAIPALSLGQDAVRYLLFESEDPARRTWSQRGPFLGRPIGLVAEGDRRLLVILDDGAVLRKQLPGDQEEILIPGDNRLRFSSAADVAGMTCAADASLENRIRLFRMDGKVWTPLGPEIAVLGTPRLVRLAEWQGRPLVLWRIDLGGQRERALHSSWLDGETWQALPWPEHAERDVFAAAAAEGLLLVREASQEDVPRLRLSRFTGERWTDLPDLVLPPETGLQRGMGLALVRDGLGWLAIRADAAGVRILACPEALARRWSVTDTVLTQRPEIGRASCRERVSNFV
jgi:hypothetical protein